MKITQKKGADLQAVPSLSPGTASQSSPNSKAFKVNNRTSLKRFIEQCHRNNKTGLKQRLRKKKSNNIKHMFCCKKRNLNFSRLQLLAFWETFTLNSSWHNLSGSLKKVENQLSFPQLPITCFHVFVEGRTWWNNKSTIAQRLVGGWTNPFEKYDRQIGSSPHKSG